MHTLTQPRTALGTRVASRETRRTAHRRGRGERKNWLFDSVFRLAFGALWVTLYTILSLVSRVVALVAAVVSIPVLMFAPVVIVAALLAAATQLFRGLGLI